jgi:hypothetical protein
VSLRTALECYYKFDGNGYDKSGRGLDLTYAGSVAYAAGKFGLGYSLNGNEANHADRGVNDPQLGFPGTTPFSVSAWVNAAALTAPAGFQSVVEKVNGPNGWGVIVLNSGAVQFHVGGFGVVTTAAGVITTIAGFQHILVVNDGTNATIYVDGSNVGSSGSAINNLTPQPLRIGDRATSNSPWNGVLDEIAIWSRGLQGSEVTQLYNSGTGRQIPGLGNTKVKQLNVNEPFPIHSSTVAGLPSAAGLLGHEVFVSDESGGPTMAFSDDAVWRRWRDRVVVS